MNALSPTIQALLADSNITALVSTRIEPVAAPTRGAMPDIIVNQITNMDTFLLGGAGCLPEFRVRVECRAETVTETITIGDAVITALNAASGTLAGVTVISFLQEGTDETDHAEDHSIYRRYIDYYVRIAP